jgi:membrane-bound lytic murein transglycosylase D
MSRLLTGALAALLLSACATAPGPAKRTASDPAASAPAATAAEPAGGPDPATADVGGLPRSPLPVESSPDQPTSVPLPDDPYSRLARQLDQVACENDRVVQRWIDLYASRPDRLEDKLDGAAPLLDFVLREVERRELPAQFALLPLVESTYQPLAGRRAGAFGLWQFMPPTARAHGLRVDAHFDARLAPAEATRAALDYLEGLYQRFDQDWRLAALGFNAGEYRIKTSLRNGNGKVTAGEHQPPGLALTSYEYLGKLKALSCLIAGAERFGIDLPREPFEPLEAVRAPAQLRHIWDLADAAGLSADELRRHNPALSGMVRPAGSDPLLLLPRSAARRLAGIAGQPERLAQIAAQPARGHQVQAGETLYGIARRYGLALADLLRWNGLREGAIIRPGQWLRLQPQ